MFQPTQGSSARRPGFTMAEVLVVIAILAILAAMSAGAIMQVLGSQKKTATETLITSLASELDKQWKAAIDDAVSELKQNGIPSDLLTLAGNDPDRARVIYVKFRLKQEFPTSYAEILDPIASAPRGGKPAYRNKLVDPVTGTPRANLNASQAWQSSACLLMVLHQNRRGMVYNPEDQLPANAIANKFNDGMKQIVDVWGNPIIFIRWPTTLADINPTGLPKPGINDPQDPKGLLSSPSWLTSNGGLNYTTFKGFCHDVGYLNGPLSYELPPVIASAGRNGYVDANGDLQNFNDGDDIYSYRLRKAENRGD